MVCFGSALDFFLLFLKLLEKHGVLARSGFLYILLIAETHVWVSTFSGNKTDVCFQQK